MYKEYEQKMERMARILKVVKKVVLVLAIVVPVILLLFYCVGFQYRAMKCDSVVYGNTPDPKAYFTTIGGTTYEYRSTETEDAEWSTEVPTLVGEYEVRARLVSPIGIEKTSIQKFKISPKELDILLSDISIQGDPHSVVVSEADYTIGGLEYDDRVGNVRVQIDEKQSGEDLSYHLEDLTIVHADGTDATDCYRISNKTASIRDSRTHITVAAGSRTITYDGDPKSYMDYDEWTIVSGTLNPGHTAEFHCKATPDDWYLPCWHAVNRIVSGEIKDADGNIVTDQYIIEYQEGDLRLQPRKLILTSGSASKKYDGTPLTNPNFTIGGNGVVKGETLSAKCIGSIVDPGSTPNTFGTIRVENSDHEDVTDYYDIQQKQGTLKITVPSIPGGHEGGGSGGHGGSGPGGGGGQGTGEIETANENGFSLSRNSSDFSGSGGGSGGGSGNGFQFGDQENNPARVFSFYGQSDRQYYFKEYSYGEYTGSGFLKSAGEDEYKGWSDYLMGNALQGRIASRRDVVRVADLAIDHPVYPYFMTKPVTDSGEIGRYTCETYFFGNAQGYPQSTDEREAEYSNFVYSTYLDVPADVREELLDFGSDAGLYEGSYTLIEDIAKCIQNSAEYSLDFDTFPDDEDMVLYFLKVSKKGICQHYAAAATLMYRVYGIPARYVVGFTHEGRPGKWTSVTTNCGHAWVEIYIDGSGWIPVEVTGQSGFSGTLPEGDEYWEDYGDDDTYLPLTIVYDRLTKVYDGKYPEPCVFSGHVLSGRLRDGDSISMYSFEFDPDQNWYYREVGVTYFDLPVDAVRITDPAGNDVTYLYDLWLYAPSYTVEARDLSISIYGDFESYVGDWDVWDVNRMHWSISDGSLAEGHTLELFSSTRDISSGNEYHICKVGKYNIAARIFDEDGNNVTSNYNISSTTYD